MLAAAMVAVLICVTGGGAYVGAAVLARHQAQSAADLAALAGAAALPAGVQAACDLAVQVIREMRARPVDCAVQGLDVVVGVEVAVAFARVGIGAACAAARAGPAS